MKIVSLAGLAASLVTALVAFACSGTGGGPGARCRDGIAAVTFAKDVRPIMAGCSGAEICHFSAFQDAANLVNVAAMRDACTDGRVLVEPGDPDGSYLVQKLLGVQMCGAGQRMPPGQPLSDEETQVVVDWICQGAKP